VACHTGSAVGGVGGARQWSEEAGTGARAAGKEGNDAGVVAAILHI
jgi:hypothetical protein